MQTLPGKRSKQGRCAYLRRERRSFPQGQMTAEHFCHLLIYSVVFSSNSSCTPHPIPSMTLILFFTLRLFSSIATLSHSLIMKAQSFGEVGLGTIIIPFFLLLIQLCFKLYFAFFFLSNLHTVLNRTQNISDIFSIKIESNPFSYESTFLVIIWSCIFDEQVIRILSCSCVD